MNIKRIFYYLFGIVLLSVACKSVEKAGRNASFVNSITTQVEAKNIDYESSRLKQKLVNDQKLDYGSPRVEQELVNDQRFRINEYTSNETYGYTEKNPIMVGGGTEGLLHERLFLIPNH